MSAPMKNAEAATPASSNPKSALVSTLSIAKVPQDDHDRDTDTEFDTALYFMAALTVATDVHVLEISRDVKAGDLGSVDADIFEAMLKLARTGNAPTVPLVHGLLERDGMFAGSKGQARKSRMLAITTTSASALQLNELGLILVEAAFRRTARAMGEGIYDGAEAYSTREIMPYVRDLGTQLNLIDQRRVALGGETL